MAQELPRLPIDTLLPEIHKKLFKEQHNCLVLSAAPGAGKSTRVPPAVAKAFGGEVLVLQPRRVAVKAIVHRIEQEQSWPLGRELGYQMRFESKRSANDALLTLMTEGTLQRRLLNDPYLEGVSAVIFDEFHERSLPSDLALAQLRELQTTVRADLKILVMSATLEAQGIARFLGDCPVLESEGRSYPVEIIHHDIPLHLIRKKEGLSEALLPILKQILETAPTHSNFKDILVFLPGRREIEHCLNRCLEVFPQNNVRFFALHGGLNLEEQEQAIAPLENARKIVLSTNIAETSLTVEGLGYVLDSGLERTLKMDPKLGLERLELERISQSSAKQRAGRAGRQAPGQCHRLWSRDEHRHLKPATQAEIQRIDLSQVLLQLSYSGYPLGKNFPWFEAPPQAHLQQAADLLKLLKAVDFQTGAITEIGKHMLQLPLSPRMARLCLTAFEEFGDPQLGAALTALLGERSGLEWIEERNHKSTLHGSGSHSDLSEALKALTQKRAPRTLIRSFENVLKKSRSLLPQSGAQKKKEVSETSLSKVLLSAFPDRVCRLRENSPKGEAKMVGGRGLLLNEETRLRLTTPLFLALNARELRLNNVKLAVATVISPLDNLNEVKDYLPSQSFSRKRILSSKIQDGRLQVLEQDFYLDLEISKAQPTQATIEEVRQFLKERISKDLNKVLKSNDKASALLRRMDFLKFHSPHLGRNLPSVEELQDLLELQIDTMQTPPLNIEELPLDEILENKLAYPDRKILNQEAPSHLELPSTRKVPLNYSADPSKAPVLSARIQELFGWHSSPRLAQNKVPVLLELLSPGYKTVQSTDDLENFWKQTYFEVRKELRARYPKHDWPENPLLAKAKSLKNLRRKQ